jgi:2'-5' RNA ligase
MRGKAVPFRQVLALFLSLRLMPSTEFSNAWRLFVAVELPPPVRRKLIEHIERLRHSVPNARASWIRDENLHLTLKFLGEIPVMNAEKLSAAVSIATTRVEPFEIVVGGCGAFPPRGQPRVLWIGIEDPVGKLVELHRALEDECAKAGFPREARPFHPHLTIARIRKPHDSRQLVAVHQEMGFDRETVPASELALIKSELRSEGSRHTVISRHSFLSTVKESG